MRTRPRKYETKFETRGKLHRQGRGHVWTGVTVCGTESSRVARLTGIVGSLRDDALCLGKI